MNFRLLVQPAVAILFAVHAGLKDARQNEPPFLWATLSNPSLRELSQQVWTDVGKVFIFAVIFDAIYKVIVHAGILTLELLIAVTVLALRPYVFTRGLVRRIAT